jgi:chitin synthase
MDSSIKRDITIQKYCIIGILLASNALVSTTFIIYEKYWYAFLFILAIGSSLLAIMSINLFVLKIWSYFARLHKSNIQTIIKNRAYAYIIPCYNESSDELRRTLDSVALQKPYASTDKRFLFIVCDGKVIGKGNSVSTDKILTEELLSKNIHSMSSTSNTNIYSYKTWNNIFQDVDLYGGTYRNLPYILIVKHANYGKRDSLVLVRRFLFYYNKLANTQKPIITSIAQSWFSSSLWTTLVSTLQLAVGNTTHIDYIIGTDADTILDKDCTRQLISSIEVRPTIMGCVGLVDISIECNSWSPFILYQKAEYLFAQLLKRQHQSLITHKVNCLSGCVQILRVGLETCGPLILTVFNSLPLDSHNIFDHIRSYASEDRNHVCHMLSLYPYVETTQNIHAIAYTKVPMDRRVFLSQRRRWSLGAISNDMMLLYLRRINIFERIIAASNIATFAFGPFIAIATGYFVRALIQHSTMLMLYLSISLIIPFIYGLAIPVFTRMSLQQTVYYYASYFFYLTMGVFVNLAIFVYAVWYLDQMTWGKTRDIANPSIPSIPKNENVQNVIASIDSVFNKDRISEIISSELPPQTPILGLSQPIMDATFWELENETTSDANSNYLEIVN